MTKKGFLIKKGYLVFAFFVSVVFGAAFSLTPVLQKDSLEVWNAGYMIIGTVLFYGCFFALSFLMQNMNFAKGKKEIKLSDKALFGVLFAVMSIIGIGYLLIYWPGTGLYDTVYIIKTEHWGVAQQHPWFYYLIISKIVDLVALFGGGYDVAVPLISVIQIAISAGLYSYGLIWLRRKGINKIIWGIIAAVYVFSPVFSMYMITQLKDVPYSLLLFIWVPVLYDVWESEGELLKDRKTIVKICFFLILSLLRNNGIYVSAFILFGLFVFFTKRWKQLILFTGVLLLVVVGSGRFEKAHNITHLFKETVGIPLQQMAAAVYYDGEITDEQEEFINNVIPVEFIKEKYNPYSADTLKWGNSPLDNEFLNANKGEFLKVWAQMLVPNFGVYVEAYLRNTYSFWSLTGSNQNKIYDTFYVEAFKEWYEQENIGIKNILPEDVQVKLEKITGELAQISPESGMLLWMVIILLLSLGYVYGLGVVTAGLPLIGGWLTIMISTPVAFQWRYTLYMLMALPLIIAFMFIKPKEKGETKQ